MKFSREGSFSRGGRGEGLGKKAEKVGVRKEEERRLAEEQF